MLYPEVRAGGFSRVDGTVAFYGRVNAILAGIGPGAVVVDYGAGRGSFLEDPVIYRREMRNLRGRVKSVIGIDVDEAVLRNESVDQAKVVRMGESLPLERDSVDLIVCDFTFEHITNPAWVAGELSRVLKSGGWLCARTPNRWGYIAVGARVVPNEFHVACLRRLQPNKKAEDTFPTAYLLNTPRDLKRWFPVDRYEHVVYASDSEPLYVGRSQLAARLNRAAFSLTPSPLRSLLNVFLQKR
jgi:ubiquinone/menaquinone biosynthesis C-methylase UbiE